MGKIQASITTLDTDRKEQQQSKSKLFKWLLQVEYSGPTYHVDVYDRR